jgi:Carboxypeptidase regulatory-like domain
MVQKAILTLCVVLVSASAYAQSTARINGRVLDQFGAVLPGASVTVTDASTGVARDTVTNGEGLYSVPALNPGSYSVKIELPGFAPQEKRDVVVLTGATVTLDMQLGLAQLQENLTVTAASPLVETTQAIVGNSVQQREVQAIPMLNRTVAAMIALVPGAREVTMTTASAHGQSSNFVSIGGGGGGSANMLVDGLDNKEDSNGGSLLSYSLEGVQEFKVLSVGANAEYGRAPQTILLATKSGGNQFHGSIFGYGRNQSLIATDYFSDPANGGLGKQPFTRAQYGGSVGGPLVRNHVWYFAAIERIAQSFSLVRPPSVYNELQTLVTALPNIHALNSHFIVQPSRDTFAQAKVNAQFNNAHSAWVRYGAEYAYVDNDQLGTSIAGLSYSPDLSNHNHQNMWNVAGGWSWVVNPTTVNQFTTQYISYTHDTHYPQCPAAPIYLGVNLGADACLPEKLTFPTVSTGQLQVFPVGWLNLDNKLELKEDFSKQIGRHALKTGATYMLNPINGGVYGGGSPGSILFFDDPSVIVNNTNGKYPLGFQTPGIVRTLSVVSQTIGDFSSEPVATAACQQLLTADCAKNYWGSPLFNFGAYVQDDFRVSRRVTLNLGLRYDLYDYMGRKNLPNNRTFQVLQAIGSPYGKLPKLDKGDFGPRAGLAWDVAGDGKDVVRASYGVFYQQGIQSVYFNRNYISKPVLFLTQTITDTQIGVGPLANFVYGTTPVPEPPAAPTQLPAGGRSAGQWYDPNLRDQRNQNSHVGWSHVFPHDTVVAVDYTHVLGEFGWRNADINPLINGVRPLSALTQAVYGDPNLLSTVTIAASVNRSLYDELGVHFEHRFAQGNALQVNYTLAYGRGMGGVLDAGTGLLSPNAQTATADGGDIYAPWEWGPTSLDERHRVVMAGLVRLPFGVEVSPAITLATARPYTQFRAPNPSGDGSLMILDANGNPAGINNARGDALYNANARVTKNIAMGNEKNVALFAELYNIFNHANFGNQYFGNAFSPATYGKPAGFIGGVGAISTLPNSFQVQFGARFSF